MLVITEIIMDLHQRFRSIKRKISSLVLPDPAKLVHTFQQVTREICISKFLISATHACSTRSTSSLYWSIFLFISIMLSVVFYCLVFVRFMVLYETYSQDKSKLTKVEHKEILEYVRGRYASTLCTISVCIHLYMHAWIISTHVNNLV